MKRFIIITLFVISTCITCFASDMPWLKFNGSKFMLFYSSKSPENGSYINEYYKPREHYENWSELIAVHHFPNTYSPIEQAKMFREYLGQLGVPSAIEEDEENNSAIVDFIIVNNKRLPIILEFNIFKYEKDSICGTIAMQYAKRYLLNNGLQAEMVEKGFQKTRKSYIKKVKKLKIPALIAVDVDKGAYVKNSEEVIETETKIDEKSSDTEELNVASTQDEYEQNNENVKTESQETVVETAEE